MFNFQKEVVVNSLDMVKVVEPGFNGMEKKLRLHDGGEYFAKYIVESTIYRTDPVAGVRAQLTFDAAFLKSIKSDAGHIQILIELGLDGDYRGDYGSALFYFRKPVVIDINNATLTDKMLAKAFRTAIPAEYKFLAVYENGDDTPEGIDAPAANKVLLVAEDSYIKVRNVQILSFNCDDRCAGTSEEAELVAALENVDAVNAKVGNYASIKKNIVEFGTANYVLHNLRLPTGANYRFTSPMANEMPVAGKEYVQFSFAYCVPRVGFGGMSVVGQTNHSTTLHTFFVEKSIAEDFEDMFTESDGLDMGSDNVKDIARGSEQHDVTILPSKFAAKADVDGKAVMAVPAEEEKTDLAAEIAEVEAKVSKK